MFETLYAASQAFRDNMRFLSHIRLETLLRHLLRSEKERDKHAMQITQDQLDKLTADDKALGEAVTAAVSRSQDAQKSAQDTAAQLASVQQQLTTVQTELANAGSPVDLSGILTDLEGAATSVGQIDQALAPTTGTPSVTPPAAGDGATGGTGDPGTGAGTGEQAAPAGQATT